MVVVGCVVEVVDDVVVVVGLVVVVVDDVVVVVGLVVEVVDVLVVDVLVEVVDVLVVDVLVEVVLVLVVLVEEDDEDEDAFWVTPMSSIVCVGSSGAQVATTWSDPATVASAAIELGIGRWMVVGAIPSAIVAVILNVGVWISVASTGPVRVRLSTPPATEYEPVRLPPTNCTLSMLAIPAGMACFTVTEFTVTCRPIRSGSGTLFVNVTTPWVPSSIGFGVALASTVMLRLNVPMIGVLGHVYGAVIGAAVAVSINGTASATSASAHAT